MPSQVKKSFSRLIIALATMSVVLSSLHAQQVRSGDSKVWFNVPSSPLKFVEQESQVVLDPRSSPGSIKRYGLGCIRQNGELIKVTKRFGLFMVEASGEMNRFWGIPRLQHGLPKCALGNKYAVVEVDFIDGAVWKI